MNQNIQEEFYIAWFDALSLNSKWVLLFNVAVDIESYFTTDKKFKECDYQKVIEKFLNELDSPDLVSFQEPIWECGNGINIWEKMGLWCLAEDIDKLSTDEPVRFLCCTEIEAEDKEKFIKFVKDFVPLMLR